MPVRVHDVQPGPDLGRRREVPAVLVEGFAALRFGDFAEAGVPERAVHGVRQTGRQRGLTVTALRSVCRPNERISAAVPSSAMRARAAGSSSSA